MHYCQHGAVKPNVYVVTCKKCTRSIPSGAQTFLAGTGIVSAYLLFARSLGHRAVLELRPAALRSELAYRALRVSDSSPLAGSGSLSKNFFSWQRGYAATWEQRISKAILFAVVFMTGCAPNPRLDRIPAKYIENGPEFCPRFSTSKPPTLPTGDSIRITITSEIGK